MIEKVQRHRRGRALGPLLGATVIALLCVALIPASAGASWPGGNGRIAFDHDAKGNVQVFRMAPDGSARVRLTSQGNNGDPSWSPNGRLLAFDGDRTGVSQLFVMRGDGTHQHDVSPDGSCTAYPSWSPDGRSLVFVHYPDPQCTGAPDVWSSRADGTHARALTNTPGERELSPQYSPDGSQIAFAAHTSAQHTFAVFTMRANGSNRRQITPGWLNASYPDWAPGGHQLVIASGADESQSSLYTVDSDGGNLHRLTHRVPDVTNTVPRWSPDGRLVLFSSNRNGDQFELFTLRLHDGAIRRRTHTTANEVSSSWQATGL